MKLSRVMLAAAVVTALVTPAYGMTFKVEFGALWYVHASGEIINGDTERFVQSLDAAKVFEDKDPIENRIIVYLDSPGGSVAEGLKLGRVITKLRALTDVARRTKGDNFAPGICASACVLAYLGGDYRYLTKDSKIGIHQFALGDDSKISPGAATVITQVLAAEIVEWIKQNRADTEFFTLMTSTLPTGVYFVPPQKLRDLRVVTDDIWDENWSYEIIEGTNDVYLRISQRQRGGEFKLLFTCISKRILGTAMVPRPESAVWPFIVMLVLDEQFTRIPDQLIKTKPDIVGKFIASTFVVEENLVNRLLKAQKIGAAIVEESFLRRARNAQKSGAELDLKSENLYFYFQIGTAKGRDKLYKLIQGCR